MTTEARSPLRVETEFANAMTRLSVSYQRLGQSRSPYSMSDPGSSEALADLEANVRQALAAFAAAERWVPKRLGEPT